MAKEPRDLVVCVDNSGYEAALERRGMRCSQIPMLQSGDSSESSMNRVRITCTRRRTFTKSSCQPRFVGRYFTRRDWRAEPLRHAARVDRPGRLVPGSTDNRKPTASRIERTAT